ncbi:hypothetical protein CQ975_002576 [Escherichia coli]|nr:hypothetical protein [Escherichia coli]
MMNINNTEYGITVLALKGLYLEMMDLRATAIAHGNEVAEVAFGTPARIIKAALDIMEQQQDEINELKRAPQEESHKES